MNNEHSPSEPGRISGILPMSASPVGLSFTVHKLGSEVTPEKQYRELTKNGFEAIEAYRRIVDPSFGGRVDIGIDPYYLETAGIRKVAVGDNGGGMDRDEMLRFMNKFSETGKTQGVDSNFGVGAKISTLYHNREGVEIRSWKDGRGHVMRLKFDPVHNLYGAVYQEVNGANECCIPAELFERADLLKFPWILDHGTMVVLLGQSANDDSSIPPEAVSHKAYYFPHSMNKTYYRIPVGVELRTSIEQNLGKPNTRIIRGGEHMLSQYAATSGTVELIDATAHWYILDDAKSEDLSSKLRGYYHIFSGKKYHGQVAVIYQDEMYHYAWGNRAIPLLQSFGIVAGYNRVAISIEPRNDSGIRADMTRTSLKCADGTPLPWDRWADEFYANMPAELAEFVESQQHDGSADERKYVQKEIEKFKDILSSRALRPSSENGKSAQEDGVQNAVVNERGGRGGGSGVPRTVLPKARAQFNLKPGAGSRSLDEVIATFDIDWKWVSSEDASLNDRAARFNVSRQFLEVNQDFDIFRSLVDSGFVLIEPEKRELHHSRVEEIAKRLYIVHLVFAVMEAMARFRNREAWSPEDFTRLVSEEALTTAALGNPHILNEVRREVRTNVAIKRDLIRNGEQPDDFA